MGRNRQLWGKIFSFAGLIDAEWLYRRREFNVGAREMALFGRGSSCMTRKIVPRGSRRNGGAPFTTAGFARMMERTDSWLDREATPVSSTS